MTHRAPAFAPALIGLIAAAVLLAMSPLSSASAQTRRVVVEQVQIAEAVEQAREALNIPTLAVGVVGPEGPRYLAVHGQVDGGRELDQPFAIGSLSKSVTAMAVMLLVHEGQISLDAPASAWVEGLPAGLTIRHLLHQKSGLGRDDGGDGWTQREASISQMIAESTWDPPGSFSYCNLNYQLLGAIVAQVSEQRYGDFVRERIFEPLGMKSASAAPTPPADHIVGHQYLFGFASARGEPSYNPLAVPSGFVWMSARDMSRWLQVFLRRGQVDGAQVIPAEVIDALMTPPEGSPYAMGWARVDPEETGGVEVMKHTGLTGAFAASMAIAPERGVGVFALANINSWAAHAEGELVDGLLASHLGQQSEPLSNVELVVRLALGVLAALLALAFLVELARWLRRGAPRSLDDAARRRVAITIGVAAALLAVPFALGSSISLILRIQPDLGLGYLALIILSTLRVLLRGLQRS